MKKNGLEAHGSANPVATKDQKTAENKAVKRWLENGVPPHIAWPMFVVGLLALGVGWSLWVVFASRSDGGAQVVENYYEKAITWDERNKLIQQSISLGWTVELKYVPAPSEDQAGGIEVQFLDKEGQPLADLEGIIKVFRPQTTRAVGSLTLTSTDRPGVYWQAFPVAAAGLWDFEIAVERNGVHYLQIIRKEL